MVRSLIQGLIATVIGLALLPVIQEFVDGLTGTSMVYESTSVGALIDLIPVIYIIVLVVGLVAYVVVSRKA